jgi:hypothetical protein
MARRVEPPAVEPMTPVDVRLRLKYPRTDQDVAIAEWIASARDAVERYVERGLITQTWELATQRGPMVSGAGATAAALVSGESTESHVCHFVRNLTTHRATGPRAVPNGASVYGSIDLPWAAPLQAIVSVTDDDGDVDGATYAVDDTVEPARLYWLDSARPAGVAVVRYRVGYGDDGASVPSNLRQVIFALVQQYFLFRAGPPPPSALDATLMHADGYRVRALV